jgi:hypothetical protein
MDAVDGTKVWFGNLELAPGYYAERDETGVYLMDPGGRRVMRFSGDVAPEGDALETGRLEPSAKPEPAGWQELCRSLLIRLSQKSAECERLHVRVTELDERLQAAERHQANAIAEDMYEFFRKRARQVVDRKQMSRRRGVR